MKRCKRKVLQLAALAVHAVHCVCKSDELAKWADVIEDRIFEEKLSYIASLERRALWHQEAAARLMGESRLVSDELDSDHRESFGLILERVAALPEDKVVCKLRRFLAEGRSAEVLERMIDNATKQLDPR